MTPRRAKGTNRPPHIRTDEQGRKVMRVPTPEARARSLVERFGVEKAAAIVERRVAMTKDPSYFRGYWTEVGLWIDAIDSEQKHAASQSLHEHEHRIAEEEAAS